MNMQNVVQMLRERGLLEDMTSPDLEKRVEQPLVVYAGFDPTSESLQAGNYAAIMVLAHFQRCGHRVIALVGGATGMIGDPSGKSSERNLLSPEQVDRNLKGIRENLSRFLDFNHPTFPARIVNNGDWFAPFTFVDFLREVGKHFRMGQMLSKESVKARLASESGMSFAEFSYQLLQAYDFLKLYETDGCLLQIGGSDQWGNITAGIDLIRKLKGVEAYGLTIPLVCDSTGQKFGKSEGNAIYLDANKTSFYDFYQFFLRVADSDVIRFLRVFTFLDAGALAELEESTRREPEKRLAQKRLAEEVTRAVHGENGLSVALRASAVLFGESMEGLRAQDLLSIFSNVPSASLPRAEVAGAGVLDLAVNAGFCKSKGEARRLVQNGGFYVNNVRVPHADATLSPAELIDGRIVVLRSGKKTFHIVKVTGP
jgi:tyrosyl-tRNA synthetase